jgi:hypothetical protein
MRGEARLAIIHPTHAQIPHRETIYANFLTPGPHWQQVANVLHDTQPELAAEREHQQRKITVTALLTPAAGGGRKRIAQQRRIDHLPNGLAPELLDACVNASRRIRLERQVAYERPVILESAAGELTLLPITETETNLHLPFDLSRGTETLTGNLILGDRDPLPLLISEDTADEDAIVAWTCALLGFADATCIELESAEPTARHQPATRLPHPLSAVSQQLTSTRTLPRRPPWPRRLEPIGHWARYSGSFVAGHRRRLNDGHTASDRAHSRARQVGIILRPHETWKII